MKLKNMWKRFWTLDVHNHEGFTLVELIIVIAILAILSTGAIAGYSAYVESANKTADKALVSEIANVLTMHAYAYGIGEGGHVIISPNGAAKAEGAAVIEALRGAYGDNWDNALKLKYTGWPKAASQDIANAFNNSSFEGNVDDLLTQIGGLTTQLSAFIGGGSLGAEFDEYTAGLGVNVSTSQEKANAAVLYVANTAKNVEDEQDIVDAFDAFYASGGSDMNSLTTSLGTSMGTLGACATIYAQAEAFCLHIAETTGDTSLLEQFHNDTANVYTDGMSGNEVLNKVGAAMQSVVNQATTSYGEHALNYVEGDAEKDTLAFLAAMEAVVDNEGYLKDRLGQDNCFTDGFVSGLVDAYLAGAVAGANDGDVVIVITADGQTHYYPRVDIG